MALANIILGDGQATPLNRTFEVFTPQVGGSTALLNQKSSGVTKLFDRLSLLLRRAEGSSSYRQIITLKMPRITDAVRGTVETAHIDLTVVIPDGFTPAMRADIAAYLKNLTATTVVQNSIKDVVSYA